MVCPDRGLVFPSVSYVRNIIQKAAAREGLSTMPVVLDCTKIHLADFTAASGMKVRIFLERDKVKSYQG